MSVMACLSWFLEMEVAKDTSKALQGNTREHKQQQILRSLRRLFDITTLHELDKG